ncbi:hypothetical protein GCM10010507_26160 [Streptomyces cinnamoneus]|uniref:Uncharacterized protein n=1 Tax=Streptomyces cinnamoneus TaxID=53446 RepID=A0A918WGJ2_STRCJ|nr:hypothetical protein GCM10010507_26160 [Streptomyces cinnamoneus]
MSPVSAASDQPTVPPGKRARSVTSARNVPTVNASAARATQTVGSAGGDSRRGRDAGSALSVGFMPVPLTAGGARATAGAHLNSRAQKATAGSDRQRLPEWDPAFCSHLVCAVGVMPTDYAGITPWG